ncbi:uncharacterized protein LAESUDRAFT_721477 [Laetiporus sulphureus 93-53]|uniref:Uncharacterized protein n=1 Tax=Laetiporus sulphureus 93-53 TaxID=1314785 RepID=A0A165H005_9APHY|nr:uncharacterized protein LAESUDRAFT_721477 [Laetiporus sulphureus 93-53]KZT11060.1 hypothetical protein LAESUDRAFT_721477 [Laetiporus sulphureus 93-53]
MSVSTSSGAIYRASDDRLLYRLVHKRVDFELLLSHPPGIARAYAATRVVGRVHVLVLFPRAKANSERV